MQDPANVASLPSDDAPEFMTQLQTSISLGDTAFLNLLQWNLSIADMLYSGHLSIADTFPKNG